MLTYGSNTDGKQIGCFFYDVWDPANGSHLTYDNTSGTDLFCSSQLVLADASGIVISGGDT